MTTRILVVNCYYCRGTGKTGGIPLVCAPTGDCGTCAGEGRLRLDADGVILGPQPMCSDEVAYDGYCSRMRAHLVRPAPPPPPTPSTPPETAPSAHDSCPGRG